MNKREWKDLTSNQKMLVCIFGVLEFGLLIAALWVFARRSPDEVRGPRKMWFGLVFINWIGPICYFAFGRKKKQELPKAGEVAEAPADAAEAAATEAVDQAVPPEAEDFEI